MNTPVRPAVTLRIIDGVGEIQIDSPPVNALGRKVRQGLHEALQQTLQDPAVRVILITAAGRMFSAGADIREFDEGIEPPHLPELIDAFECSSKPVVAAIHGAAMGGGLELALGCHYRVATPAARLGLPEVKIGLIPGAGGTQRLPRLIGVPAALDMITRGSTIDARRAQQIGLVDQVFEAEVFMAQTQDFAQALVQQSAPARRTSARAADPKPDAIAQARAAIHGRPGSAPAAACIDAVEAAMTLSFHDGLEVERERFAQCMHAPEAAALRHVFFAERQASQLPDLPADVPVRRIGRAVVIGAGTMGSGIAMSLAECGIDVTLVDQSDQAVQRGYQRIARLYEGAVERGRISASEREARLGRIHTGGYDALGTAELVIEAVFEDLELKKKIFRELDERCRPDTLLATNTSTLDVDAIAAVTQRPQDVLGLHFFSPANVMRLLEIVRAEHTGLEVLATAIQLGRRLGKVGVVSGVCDGFIGNRMLEGYLREVGLLLLEGAAPLQIDSALTAWGWAMGPCAVSDLAGIDIGHAVREQRGVLELDEPCYAVGEALYQAGRHGQKTGRGFYRYADGKRVPQPDPEVDAIAVREARRFAIERREIGTDEIVRRCLAPLIREGQRILDEGIALRASDIDLVWVYGYGFPAFRGGPMYYAAQHGLA